MRAGGLVLVVLCAASSALAAAKDDFPIGHWYMEKHGKAYSLYSVDRLYPNGVWVSDFLECIAGKPRTHSESGTWKYSGNQLWLTTSLVNGVYKVGLERYDMLSHDKYHFTATTVGSDAFWFTTSQTFTETRVSPESKVPGCNPTS
jgi:hypothetical protein